MHEFSIVQALVEQVRGELERAGAEGRVQVVELAIGRISGVNVDAVRFAFEVLAKDTELEGAELRIRQPCAKCYCRACGGESELGEFALQCPKCSATDITITGGRELVLESIEVDQAE